MFEDFYLRWLLSMVEDSDFRTDITLSVGGTFLMGNMISEKELFERLSGHVPQQFRDTFASLPDQFDAIGIQRVSEGADPLEVPEAREARTGSYIHLEHVRIFEAGEYHSFPSVFWRGKVSEVDGFWLGTPSRDE